MTSFDLIERMIISRVRYPSGYFSIALVEKKEENNCINMQKPNKLHIRKSESK